MGGMVPVYVMVASGLIAVTLYALRGGLVGRNRLAIVGLDATGLGMGLLAILVAGYLWGPLYGFGIILAVMIHEFGHVAAFRVCGHSDARFRLIPLLGGVAISDSQPVSQMKDFFITLLGPGISVAPMAAAFTMAALVQDSAPVVAEFLWVFATVSAVLNFLNLLPFWPLDGGRMVRILAFRFGPGVAHRVTVLMSAGLAVAAVMQQSMILFVFALVGAQSIMQADGLSRVQRPMSWGQWGWSLAAYLFTGAAHFYGARPFLMPYL